jgi:LAGLIDADG-like domain
LPITEKEKPQKKHGYALKKPHTRGYATSVYTVRCMSETETAYLAGLFEGEGSIVWDIKPGRTKLGKIVIVMTNREVIEQLCKITGVGKVCEIHAMRYAGGANRKMQYHWAAYSANAAILLQQMYPWLIEKKSKAKAFINFYSRFKNGVSPCQ